MKKIFLFSLFLSSILFAKDQTTIYFQDDSGNLITAQEGIESEPKASPMEDFPTQNYQKAFYRMFGFLMGIVALIVLTYFLMKRFMNAKIQQANESKSIKILEKRVISPKSVLYLIEAEGKKVLISESQQEVRPIHNLEEARELIPQEIEF